MSLDAPALSLAFSAPTVKGNLEAISKLSLQGHRKKLGVGCVSVQAKTKEDVDALDVVIQRLNMIRDKVGEEQMRLSTRIVGCGALVKMPSSQY